MRQQVSLPVLHFFSVCRGFLEPFSLIAFLKAERKLSIIY